MSVIGRNVFDKVFMTKNFGKWYALGPLGRFTVDIACLRLVGVLQ